MRRSQRAIINVDHYMQATSQLAQTTLRSVLGKHELDEMLAERDKLNGDIQTSWTSRQILGELRWPTWRSSTSI
jgi:regulator of protease activity HflC (stomatin/prohibitin superfamily)